jgi:hypothetical protein
MLSPMTVGVAIIASLTGFWCGQEAAKAASNGNRDTSPTIDQIQQLASLATLKVNVADVQQTSINGYTGGIRAAILVKGEFLLAVDLTQAKFESKNNRAKAAVIVLPDPKVLNPRLDHDKTRLFGISEGGLWVLVPGDAAHVAVLNQAYRNAQKIVALAANPAIIQEAKQHAEQVIKCFFQAVGWTVTIVWSNR